MPAAGAGPSAALSAGFLLGFFEGIGMDPILAILVVLLSFFGIAQHFIGFIDLLEFFIGFLVIGIQVWVMLAGQFPVGRFYFVGRRGFVYA